jgi:Tfp pilus assembly protein PilX
MRPPNEGRLPFSSDGRRSAAAQTETGGQLERGNNLRRRLESESGIALVMAVGIMAVLMITGATVIFYAGSNARNAEYSADDARALNLAEAGVDYARSILWNDSDPTTPTTFSGGPLTLEGGTVTYSGAYDTATKTWTLTGNGTYTNPTGAAALVSRTASSQVLVSTTGGVDAAWGYLFADSTTSCTNLKNFIEIDAPLYVRGDLCMENQAVITSDLVQVRGKVDVKDSASIGTAEELVQDVEVGAGCSYPWNATYFDPCDSGQQVYRTNFSNTPPNIDKLAIDLAGWYTNAKPGPTTACSPGYSFPGTFDNDGVLNRSNGTQFLMPLTAYDCQVKDGGGNVLGRIAYTPGSPGTFIIEGVVFFDGKIELSGHQNVVYQGRGSIYASGEIKIQNYVTLCGAADCNAAAWNPEVNLLLLVSGAETEIGFVIENNTKFQGAVYVVNDYNQKNSVDMCGPVMAEELLIENGSTNCFVPFSTAPAGMPGTSGPATFTLTNVPNSFTTD